MEAVSTVSVVIDKHALQARSQNAVLCQHGAKKRPRDAAYFAAANRAARACKKARGAALEAKVAELEAQLASATAAQEAKNKELLLCQETLAVTKTQLLNMQMAQEEMMMEQQQMANAPASTAAQSSGPASAASAALGSAKKLGGLFKNCLLYTSPSPRD